MLTNTNHQQTMFTKFERIPYEVYGIIINFMQYPQHFNEINKDTYNFIKDSVYAKCYYKNFVLVNHILFLILILEITSKSYITKLWIKLL